MLTITPDKIGPVAAERITPFLQEMVSRYQHNLHSIHITGTAITGDFMPDVSDVNSLVVLQKMDMKFLGLLCQLGRKHRRHRVAAPLIMTPEYIQRSLDVFPVEFLNFRLIHATVFGDDILEHIEIHKKDLRSQCERELKVKLIALRQGYISSLGNRKALTDGLVSSITGYIPLFRAIIFLFGTQPPVLKREVLTVLSETTKTDTGVFARLLEARHKKARLTQDELDRIFEDDYVLTEKLMRIVDDIKV